MKGKPRVVMVEDEKDLQTLAQAWLSPAYEHVSAADGEELFKRLASGPMPRLVILDVGLPGEDGFEVCRRLRDDQRYADLPVLFLTGSREARDYQRNMKAGGTAYLMKPIGRKQFLAAVDELLKGAPDDDVGVVD